MPSFPGTPGPDTLTGTDGDDILNGPSGSLGDDVIDGRAGHDTLFGGGGDDTLEGGDGDDLLTGGETGETPAVTFGSVVFGGGDFASYRTASGPVVVDLRLTGAQDTGQGRDTLIEIENLYGGNYGDTLTGDNESNVLSGLGGSDRLFGMGGNDILLGGDGDDHLDGGSGDDELWGGAGIDMLRGGTGADTIHVRFGGTDDVDAGDGDDLVIIEDTQAVSGFQGGAGRDTLFFAFGQLILDSFSAANGFELCDGSSPNGGVLGTSGDNILDFSSLSAAPDRPNWTVRLYASGGMGRDTIVGLAGDGRDIIFGDTGVSSVGDDDVLFGMGGDDEISGDGGNDRIYGGDGNDRLDGGDGDDLLSGGRGNDIIYSGGGGADDIDAGEGDDTVVIGGSVRTLQGGSGTDTLVIDYASLSSFSASNGFERFGGLMSDLGLDGTIGDDSLDFSSLTAETSLSRLIVRAGNGNDVVTGVGGAMNNLFGQIGNDTLRGGDFNDWLGGGEGNDKLFGGAGDDLLEGNEGDDELVGGAGNDTFKGGPGNDLLDGGDGIDTLDFSAFARGGVAVNLELGSSISEGEDQLISIENVRGSRSADGLTGSSAANVLSGGDGNDSLDGRGGDDVLVGGTGSDTITGGAGIDRAVWSGLYQGYAHSGGFSGMTIGGGAEGGTDSVAGVETVQFLDGALSYETDTWQSVVYRMYDAAFDRGPDPFGMKTWSEALANGTNLRVLSDTFEASAEFQTRYGALNNTNFIKEMYRFSLNREADAPGLLHWENLMAGGMSRAEVLFHFSESQEHKTVMTNRILAQGMWIQDEKTISIARLYDAILDRVPDLAGLKAYRAQMETGATLTQVATALMQDPGFQTVYGGLSNQAFVEKMYLTILNRAGTANEISILTGYLNNGTPRVDLLLGLSETIEHALLYQATWNTQVRTLENGLHPAPLPDEAKHAEVLPVLSDDAFAPQTLPGEDRHDAKALIAEVSPLTLQDADAHILPGPAAEILPAAEVKAEVSPAAEILPGAAEADAPTAGGFDRTGDTMWIEDAFVLTGGEVAPVSEVLPTATDEATPAAALPDWLLLHGDMAAFDSPLDHLAPADHGHRAHAPHPDDLFA